ncbi:plasmid replication protein, CyRepA1 family [Vibrio cholerae]
MTTKKLSLTRFYEQEFGSDPQMLLNDAASEIIGWARIHNIDLDKIFSRIRLVSQGAEDKLTKYESYAEMNKALPPELKGKATLISHLRTTNGGIAYPYLALLIKGSIETTWNGYEYLVDKYESQIDLTPAQQSEAVKRAQEKQRAFKEQQAKREAERAEREALAKKKRDEDIAWLNAYRESFKSADAELGDGPYFSKKKIGEITTLSNVKRLTDDRVGMHTSIPLIKLEGKDRGATVAFQRILDNPISIKGKLTGKLTTVTTEPEALKGAVHVFGDLVNGQRIFVGEGYATVASAMLAKNGKSGVMAYSANNLVDVVAVLRRNYPESELYVLVDNDHDTCRRGEGNAGMLAAIKILESHAKSKKVRCYVPTFENMNADSKKAASDFNDIHCRLGLAEVARQIGIGAKKNRIEWDVSVLERNLFKLRYVKNKDINKQLKRCVLTGMNAVPKVISKAEFKNLVVSELKRLAKRRENFNVKAHAAFVCQFIDRVDAAHTARAMAFRSFSSRIINPKTRPEHVNYVRFDTTTVTDEIVNFIRSCKGPVILRAGMGSRKSSKAIRQLMREAERGILTAHRQTLTHDLYRTMADAKSYDLLGKDRDMIHYQDQGIGEVAPYAKKLVCCINSIIKGIFRPLVTDHDFFGMDEATQTLRSVLTGNAMAYPVEVYNYMKLAIASTTSTVLLCDADANDHLITLLERANDLRPGLGLEKWEKINVIDLPVSVEVECEDKTMSKIRIDHSEPNTVFLQIQEAIENGERVLLATDSTRFAEQVREFVLEHNKSLKKNCAHKRVLYVSQDTKPEIEVKEFQDNPEVKAKLYEALIYSPAISSGVSINVRHFTRHFGVFYGEIAPSDAIQMLRRDRKATQFTLGLGSMNHNRETDLMRMVRGFIEVSKDATCKLNIEEGTYCLGTHDTEFNRARMEMMVEENRARSDFSNQLLRILEADGYQVHRLCSDELTMQLGAAVRKEMQELIDIRKFNLHMDSPTPSDDRRDELLKQNTLSEAERAELNRWDIENLLCEKVDLASYEFWLNGGVKKAARFELLQMDQDHAQAFDDLESRTEYSYTIQMPNDQYPKTFSYKAHSEDEALKAMHRQFACLRIISAEPEENENGIYACVVKHNGKQEKRRVVASTVQEASEWLYKNYFDGQIIAMTKTPVVEISKRQNLSTNRKLLVQYLLDCGIDPQTGKGEATQDAMKQAMNNLIKTEAMRDVFNNIATLWGGRLDQFGKKRPTDMFKLVAEQLGLEATKRRLTVSEGRGVVWYFSESSWQSMAERNAKRKAAGVTSYEVENLENKAIETIHDQKDISIYNEMIVDHADDHCGNVKADIETPWNQLISTAAKLVNLPVEWATSLFREDERTAFINGTMKLRHLCMVLRDQYIMDHAHEMNYGDFMRLKNWTPMEV